MNTIFKYLLSLHVLLFCATISIYAQEAEKPQHAALDAETLKKANDPMAHVKAFNVHNYIISDIYGAPDAAQNQLMFRYAQPIGKMLVRATLPIITSSGPEVSPKTGMGDLNIFAIYSVDKNGTKFGVGPLFVAPTGTNDFSSEKWQAGLAALVFAAKNPILQGGALLQWQTSFAGEEEAKDVDMMTSQLFGMWQLGGGTYLRSTGIWSFDLMNGNYNIPLGLGIGKVIKVNNVVFNIFAEPQFSVASKGIGQSKLQTFIGFNAQF